MKDKNRSVEVDQPSCGLFVQALDGAEFLLDLAGADADELSVPEDRILEEPVIQAGNVYGSYIHGIFDSQACGQAVVSSLLAAKGLDESAIEAVDMRAYKEAQYDKLADAVRNSLDMDLIYRILNREE